MSQDQLERLALFGVLLALVLTGGASSAWRLAFVGVPLLVFQLPLRWTLAALLLVALPSAAELFLYGNWIGSFGGRVSLLASTLVMSSSIALGVRLLGSRALRQSFAQAMPVFAIGLALQAGIRLFELLPASWQYLSGNHLSSLVLVAMVPAIGLRMDSVSRAATIGTLLLALALTGSRWGIWVGVVFSLLMVSIVWAERIRYAAGAALCVALAAPWALFGAIDNTKPGLLRALSGISGLRPWSGLGPGGAEQVSLQFVERTASLTHIETSVFDWPATLGFPMSIGLLIVLLFIVFRSKAVTEVVTVSRLQKVAAVGILGVLCHDLMDFSLFSGALRVGLGCLIGLSMPLTMSLSTRRWSQITVAVLMLSSFACWHHYDPMRMEQSNRLDELPEAYGQRPFRYWLNRGVSASTLQDAQTALSRSVSIAPGNRESWFLLGDALRRRGLTEQGLLAYRRGLETTRNLWTGAGTEQLATLPVWMIKRVIGDHLGAARSVARRRTGGSQKDHQFVAELDQLHRDSVVRRYYVQGLLGADRAPSYAVPLLWKLAQEEPLVEGDGVRFLRHLLEREPRADGAQLLLRLVRSNPIHCLGLGIWPEIELVQLYPITEALDSVCRKPLLGRGPALRRLSTLRELRSP